MSGQQALLVPLETRSGVGIADLWRWPLFLVCISLVFSLISFEQTVVAMVHTWLTSRTYSHCFLIVPLFAYLVWIRRKRIAALRPGESVWGMLLLAALVLVWFLGNLAQAKVVQEFALIAIIGATVWTLLGTRVVRVLGFPLVFLFFSIPFGVSLVGPLQEFTAWFAVHALVISNVPAVLENRTIWLPNGAWTVAETCSGIRYLFASIVFGVVFCSLVYRSRKRQLVFLAASIAVPIAANGVRAYGIVLLGYLSDNKIAAGVDHLIYGGAFLAAVQIALLTMGWCWREETTASTAITADGLAVLSSRLKNKALLAAVAMTLTISAPLWAAHLWSRSAAAGGQEKLSVVVDPSWQPVAIYDTSWAPSLHDSDEEFSHEYKSGANRVDLCLALYSGRREMELVGTANRFANPKLWSLAAEKLAHTVINGHDTTLNKSLVESGSRFRSVWTVYWVSGEYTASPTRVKLLQAKARVLGKTAGTIVIILGSEDPVDSPGTADRALQNFLAHASFSISGQ